MSQSDRIASNKTFVPVCTRMLPIQLENQWNISLGAGFSKATRGELSSEHWTSDLFRTKRNPIMAIPDRHMSCGGANEGGVLSCDCWQLFQAFSMRFLHVVSIATYTTNTHDVFPYRWSLTRCKPEGRQAWTVRSMSLVLVELPWRLQ